MLKDKISGILNHSIELSSSYRDIVAECIINSFDIGDLKEIKKIMKDNILKDGTLSKFSKIKKICENHLGRIVCHIWIPFPKEWYEQFTKEVGQSIIDDCCLSSRDRHELVYIHELVDEYEEEDSLVPIFESRGHNKKVFYKTKEEVIDALYEFVQEEDVIAFEIDW